MLKQSLVALAVLAGASIQAHADVRVEQAWVRATVPGQKATGAFMQLQADSDARLVGARSALTPVVQLHEMHMDGGTMRMHEIGGMDLPKGKVIKLEPGHEHVMLLDLKQPVRAGQRVPITLDFEQGNKRFSRTVQAEVRALGQLQPASHAHGDEHHAH